MTMEITLTLADAPYGEGYALCYQVWEDDDESLGDKVWDAARALGFEGDETRAGDVFSELYLRETPPGARRGDKFVVVV